VRTTIVALGLTLLVACADAPATPTSPGTTPGAISHPTAADELILSVGTEGGYVPTEFLYTNAPGFALYGDGTIVVPGAQAAIYPGGALPPLFARTVSEEGIQTILRAAIDAGLTEDADVSDLGNVMIADAGTAVFTLTVDGETHRVTAYALGLDEERDDGQPEHVWEARRALSRFRTRLGDLDGWLPAGSLGDERPFEAEAARLLIGPYRGDPDLPQDPAAWPLTGTLAETGQPAPLLGDGWRCTVLEGSDWAAVAALAAGANQLTPWTSGGEPSSIVFRPLLPDERRDCEPAVVK
jgi:hypothetical protein